MMDAPPSIRLREPAGERRVESPLVIGGAAGDLVRVPGAGDESALRLEWRGDGWVALGGRGANGLRANGEPLGGPPGHELRGGRIPQNRPLTSNGPAPNALCCHSLNVRSMGNMFSLSPSGCGVSTALRAYVPLGCLVNAGLETSWHVAHMFERVWNGDCSQS